MGNYLDHIYQIVKEDCQGLDAIYEDYIIKLIGISGFTVLRKEKLLLSCGSMNGRNLYTLEKMKG